MKGRAPLVLLASLAILASACNGNISSADIPAADDTVADVVAPTDASRDGGGEDGEDVGSSPARLLGLLQFRVQHNLADDTCLADDSCTIVLEDEADLPSWLAEIRGHSNFAVLHDDHSLPWHVFAQEVPEEEDLVAFYEERFDPALRAWMDAFAEHFAALPVGYVSVPLLGGARDRLQPLRWSADERELPVTDACPDLSPDRVFEVATPDGGTVSFPLGVAWLNAARYYHARLQPAFLAIGQEVNMFRTACPDEWSSLVALYRRTYDALRAELPAETALFTTLTWQHLLDYSMDACFAPLPFRACDDSEPAPEHSPVDEATCYPLDRAPLDDLDEGDRLEILALSFYPDSLSMAPPGVEAEPIRVWDPAAWPDGTCAFELPLGPFLDPFARLDDLGWTKPVALAEISTRSCATLAWSDEGESPTLLEAPGNLETQAWWLDRILRLGEERELAFTVWSFLRDYDVLGPWLVEVGLFDPWTLSVVNTWPGSGLLDRDGGEKTGVTEIWRQALDEAGGR